MFAYCGNNPVNRTDSAGQDWWHWAVAAAVVVAAAVAVVATAGGATAAIVAIASVANGVAASTTAATVAAGVFIGSSTALAASAYAASLDSNSVEEFAEYGESAMYSTIGGGIYGGVVAYGMREPHCPSKCFVAGTLIHTSSGYKPIESIHAGDMVWAWDEESGDVALKEVVETYVNEASELVHVFVNGEEIVATPSHPFYSPVKGWTDAVHLRAGDILVLVNGEYVVVEKVLHEILESPITVYNFQVKDFHTYFVTCYGILVHNACQRGVGGKGWQNDKTWRENVNTVAEGGTITELNGGIPTQTQGVQLINQARGQVIRIEGPHQYPNPHTYPHINYVVNDLKSTLRILAFELGG